MRYLDFLAVCIFAIAPAIIVAAFAGWRQHGMLRTALLMLASTPCLVLAYSTVQAFNRHAPESGVLAGGAITGVGVALVAFAARLGRNLWAGWGLVLLAGMASAPLVWLAAAVLYSNTSNTPADPVRRRDLSYPEQIERLSLGNWRGRIVSEELMRSVRLKN